MADDGAARDAYRQGMNLPWCPVCRQKVATRPTQEAGLRGVFVEHGGCEGEGRKALDQDWGFVAADDGSTVPAWEFLAPPQKGDSGE